MKTPARRTKAQKGDDMEDCLFAEDRQISQALRVWRVRGA